MIGELSPHAVIYPECIKKRYFQARLFFEEGKMEESGAICTEILLEFSSHPRAWHLRGMIALQSGDSELAGAVSCFEKAVEGMPSMACFHASLGQALKRVPERKKLAEALEAMKVALKFAPDNVSYLAGTARMLSMLEHNEEACEMLRKASQLDPANSDLQYGYAKALRKIGRKIEAAEQYRQVLLLHPAHELARFWLSTLSDQEPPPSKCPELYIQKLYSGYASKFESHLVGELGYQTPSKMAALLSAVSKEQGWQGCWDTVLDLGCGTGLSGLAVRHLSSVMIGVDLSPAMIEEAKKKQIYTELHVSDITHFLRLQNTSMKHKYDLVVACDVLVYLGNIDAVFDSVKALFKGNPKAVFAFSTEAYLEKIDATNSWEAGYNLNDTGRFSHTKNYIQSLCFNYGFQIHRIELQEIRQNRGVPVKGYLVVCSCT